jgi:cellulose synthase/poly-beta-1,6-N-acetylglucosamine synthase-like glycosyltransferase
MVIAVIAIIILLMPVMYSYFLYPIILYILPKKKEYSAESLLTEQQKVAVVIPIHNEEKLLAQKIESILLSNFPIEKLELFLLFDACTDSSFTIAQGFHNRGIRMHLIPFEDRMGKPQLLNYMMQHIDINIYPITIFNDANVLFMKDTLENLLEPFKQEMVGLVDSHVVPESEFNIHESTYLQYEYFVKYLETVKLGYMQGPFGGCYAIRTQTFTPIPDNFLVDDFFIGSNVILRGYNSIVAKDAQVVEHYSSDWRSEFLRKRRISGGNFQNLFFLFPLYLKKRKYVALFCFISHKVLRWLSPIFLAIAAIIILLVFWRIHVSIQFLLLILVIVGIDLCLSSLIDRTSLTKRIMYFLWMNIATALGCWDYITGIGNNIWQRTER